MAEPESRVKRSFICLSSSSSSEDSDTEDEEEVEESGGDDEEEDDAYGEEEEEEEEGKDEHDDDDESLCHKVIRLLGQGSEVESLTLRECKAYLKKYGLRLAGTKAVCIQRIKEHWRIKDGRGEVFYPRSTFVINCTGDVCKGDVVMFTQKVYERFNKVTRHGRRLGKRTIAGKVVSESYGAARQQHTFTVEVLWSKGMNRLPPLFPLLVKGRNLYRLRTFRQHWSNESQRLEVLAEKHKRGTAARLARAMKRTKKTCSTRGGIKRQKQFHHIIPSQLGKTAAPEKGKHFDRHGKATSQSHGRHENHPHHCEVPPVRQVNIKGNAISGASMPARRHQQFAHPNGYRVPTSQPSVEYPENPYQAQLKFHNGGPPYKFCGYDMGSTSTMMRLPPFRVSADASVVPTPHQQGFNHRNYTHSAYNFNFESRNFGRIPASMSSQRLLHSLPLGTETYEQRKYKF